MTNLTPLRQSAPLKDMSDGEIETLGGFFNEKVMAEGMTVFVENMPGESLFLIRQGVIKISRMLAEGEEKTLVILGAEEVFGEMAIFDAAPRSATARVAEEARLLSLRKADYEVLCEQNPLLALKLTRNIIRVFSRRMRENDDEYREMLFWCVGKQT